MNNFKTLKHLDGNIYDTLHLGLELIYMTS